MQHLQHMWSFSQEGKNIRNDHQLDLQGLFRAPSIRSHKHMVQCDQVKIACNVTPV